MARSGPTDQPKTGIADDVRSGHPAAARDRRPTELVLETPEGPHAPAKCHGNDRRISGLRVVSLQGDVQRAEKIWGDIEGPDVVTRDYM